MSEDLVSPDDLAFVSFGREICGDLEPALRREWLVTNGLGGYASGTIAGINTRRYHGLLVAALQPPVARTVLVSSLQEAAISDGQHYPLSTHEYADGTIDPQGYRYLREFRLEGMLPVWVFELGDALLERRLCMHYGANTTYLVYRAHGTQPIMLTITPLATYRDFHSLRSGQGWQPQVEAVPHGAKILAGDGATPYWLLASAGSFTANGTWWWNFSYRQEAERGQDDRDDLFAPGTFTCTLAPGESWTLALTTEPDVDLDGEAALATATRRQQHLLRQAQAEAEPPLVRQLVLAADQFLVTRQASAPDAGPSGRTVIAGYHWFNDWGRDTMIALAGLTLATGRPEEAADILRTFARYIMDGLLPNNFPDSAGTIPGYNTADATLWYVVAVARYAEVTGDTALVDELLPALREIVDCHLRGTRYNIGVDPADGLLHAGEPGVQLTWMDAKVDDWVVTPRIGKPNEINALWYNVLCILEGFSRERGDTVATDRYGNLAERVRISFRARFVHSERSWLADVVDGPDGDDWSFRPNQIFALSLPFPLLEGATAARVLDGVVGSLYTTYGLRTLAPDDPAYRGHYGGDRVARDGAYHQGTVWAWLLGPYAEAHYQVHGDAAAALALFAPFQHHLTDACLGSISEIFDGDPPYTPRGCIAQAWSVAEALRVWRLLPHENTLPASFGAPTL